MDSRKAQDSGGEGVPSFELAIPITLISTPRRILTTCNREDRIEDVIRDTREADFDHVPVTVGEDKDEIIGILKTKPDRTGCVGEEVKGGLSEPLLIGGDASILDFVRRADTQPCRLVLAGTRICGLVTLSDLQKLPARAALFGLMTELELLLQETIRRAYDPMQWQGLLSDRRREFFNEKLRAAENGNVRINDEIVYTELCDKLDIVRNMPGIKLSAKQKERLVTLRNQLAHANDFATSEEAALNACRAVRDALALRQSLGQRAS